MSSTERLLFLAQRELFAPYINGTLHPLSVGREDKLYPGKHILSFSDSICHEFVKDVKRIYIYIYVKKNTKE